MKKKYEEGFHSFADMNSSRFDPSLLENHTSLEKAKKIFGHRHHKSSIDRLLEVEFESEI